MKTMFSCLRTGTYTKLSLIDPMPIPNDGCYVVYVDCNQNSNYNRNLLGAKIQVKKRRRNKHNREKGGKRRQRNFNNQWQSILQRRRVEENGNKEGLEILTLTGNVEDRMDKGNQQVKYLTSLCEWMSVPKVGCLEKRQALLKTTRNRTLWGAMIAHALKCTASRISHGQQFCCADQDYCSEYLLHWLPHVQGLVPD